MKRTPDQIRVLLIQIRQTENMARHEFDCIVGRCRLNPRLVEAVNIVKQAVPTWASAEAADVVMIGGAGEYSVTQTHPFDTPLSDLVHRATDAAKPMVGLCWGHQFIARELGGEVITDPDWTEAGTHYVRLTEAGRKDPLFAEMPEMFYSHMGHKDYVSQLPPDGIELVATSRRPNHAYRVAGKPIYGFQFHIELNAHQLIERLTMYREIYTSSIEQFEQIRDNPVASPESDTLLPRFLDLYVL